MEISIRSFLETREYESGEGGWKNGFPCTESIKVEEEEEEEKNR